MRIKLLLALAALSVLLPAASSATEIQVYFSPKGGCEQAIVREIEGAKSSVDVAMYYLTERRISDALIAARRRGVRVLIVLDTSQETEEYSKAVYLTQNGITPYINSKYAIMHNKYAIIDGRTVITGSYNWTASAESRNAENLLIIRDRNLARAYQRNFDTLLSESEPFSGRSGEDQKQND